MNRTGSLRLIARQEPDLPNLCRLLVGCNALPENLLHITLGGATTHQGEGIIVPDTAILRQTEKCPGLPTS